MTSGRCILTLTARAGRSRCYADSRPRYQFIRNYWIIKTCCTVLALLSLPSVSVLNVDFDTQPMHDLCMAAKTISIEIDAFSSWCGRERTPRSQPIRGHSSSFVAVSSRGSLACHCLAYRSTAEHAPSASWGERCVDCSDCVVI
jgi:hypothetical protein